MKNKISPDGKIRYYGDYISTEKDLGNYIRWNESMDWQTYLWWLEKLQQGKAFVRFEIKKGRKKLK